MQHQVVSRNEWIAARKAHLAKEKHLTRLRDRLSAERRALPWMRVDKTYVLDGPQGRETLGDLFDGRSQLIVQHFMFGPDWEVGCVGCSFMADHIESTLPHLEHHNVSFVRISRAPLAKLEAYRRRMGWRSKWLSSLDTDFNYDFNVSFRPEEIDKGKVYYNYELSDFECEEMHGTSVFTRNGQGEIFHTYSTYGRGDELVMATYALLDITPEGRNETSGLTDWVRRHDEYDEAKPSRSCHAAE